MYKPTSKSTSRSKCLVYVFLVAVPFIFSNGCKKTSTKQEKEIPIAYLDGKGEDTLAIETNQNANIDFGSSPDLDSVQLLTAIKEIDSMVKKIETELPTYIKTYYAVEHDCGNTQDYYFNEGKIVYIEDQPACFGESDYCRYYFTNDTLIYAHIISIDNTCKGDFRLEVYNENIYFYSGGQLILHKQRKHDVYPFAEDFEKETQAIPFYYLSVLMANNKKRNNKPWGYYQKKQAYNWSPDKISLDFEHCIGNGESFGCKNLDPDRIDYVNHVQVNSVMPYDFDFTQFKHLKSVEFYSVYGCSEEPYVIPASLEKCDSLESIYINPAKKIISSCSFRNFKSLNSVTIEIDSGRDSLYAVLLDSLKYAPEHVKIEINRYP